MKIRPATANDRAFVVASVPRLVAFEPPSFRPRDEIITAETRTIEAFFASPPAGSALMIAESDDCSPMGFVYLERLRDYFTLEDHGHISMIVVTEAAEGRGVGAALMRAAEDWARREGYRRLTLTVFDANSRARTLYEHLGYLPETLRYIKVL
jgi:GNAT superfamily N-acetyltransferase